MPRQFHGSNHSVEHAGKGPALPGFCQGCARIHANALDHRAESVRALWGEMLAQAQPVEHGDRIGRKNVAGPLAGEHREQDGDQAAHDMGIAVAEILQLRFATAAAVELFRQPDLAGAPLHLVGG